MNDPLENYDDLNETEKMVTDYVLLDQAFRNSFDIIIGNNTFKIFLEESENKVLAHDPNEPLDKNNLQNMMDYFIEEEEYDKCAILRDIIKELP
jgi:hypothetical protein